MNKEQFYKEYYGNSVIRDLVKEQFKDAAFAVGSGLIEAPQNGAPATKPACR